MPLRPSNDPFPEDVITVHEAAALVRVSAKTISRRLWAGHLRHWRDQFSGRIRLSRADVVALWECRAPGGAAARARKVSPGKRAAERAAALKLAREMCGLPAEG
jgi:excisionase family DNA binding protein